MSPSCSSDIVAQWLFKANAKNIGEILKLIYVNENLSGVRLVFHGVQSAKCLADVL
jgi:hypothetical protein